jgi:hypothetical protein
VAVLLLLGAAAGAYDYVMTMTQNLAYLAMFTPEQRAYFTDLPVWQAVLWALGVWLGVVAAILFVLRRGWSAPVLTVSFLCTAVFTISCMVQPELRASMTEPMTLAGMIAALLTSLLIVLYAWAMKKRGVLR